MYLMPLSCTLKSKYVDNFYVYFITIKNKDKIKIFMLKKEKIHTDCDTHGFHLMVSIFRDEAFKNKMQMGF